MRPRYLLDCLGRDTLVRLIRERGLSSARENDERRKTLSHSYHGDIETLVRDLSRAELVSIFKQLTFFVGDEEMYLANPGKYRHEELRAFGIRAFAGRRVRVVGEFHSAAELEEATADEADNDTEVGDEAEEDEEHDSESATGGEGEVEGEVSEPNEGFFALDSEWSRPRILSRVLRKTGMVVPERLRTTRFRELIAELGARGIEACFADDPSCAVLTDEAESPGIFAKLRLRRAGDQAEPRAPKNEIRVGEGGPAIVVQAGERKVTLRTPRPSNYNLAVLRLQFLTAVPSAERRNLAGWPESYISAATKGLALRPQEATLLRAYAAGLCLGNHSPYEAIPQLRQVVTEAEWEELLSDFVSLNPFQPDFVRAIVEQLKPMATPRTEPESWRSAEPTPDDLLATAQTERASEPLAAAGRSGAGGDAQDETGTNRRDLGALNDMFKDD